SVVSNASVMAGKPSEDVVLRGFNLGGTVRVSGGSRTYYATEAQAGRGKYYQTKEAARDDTSGDSGISVSGLTLEKGEASGEKQGESDVYVYSTLAKGSIISSTISAASGAKKDGELCFNAETLLTGRAEITVNDIDVVNNLNNNNAYGDASEGTNSDGAFANCYNRMPNGDNNNNLTDDIEFDVWEFNEDVARAPSGGRMYGLNMKIDQNNKRLVYAYITSNKQFYMGNADNSGAWKVSSNDYLNPNTVGLGVNGSKYFASKHGGDDNDSYRIYSTVDDYNDKQIMAVNGGSTAQIKDVVYASTFAFMGNNVYHAFYDQLENKIKFLANNQLTNGQYQTVAGGNVSSSRGVGKYIGLAVTRGKNPSNQDSDIVSMVWYNQITNKLQYSYNNNPVAATDNQATPANWSSPVDVFPNDLGGQYCQVVADSNNGIHIAANVGGKVMYAYASSAVVTSSSGFSTCIVDINAGKHLTLDVAMASSGEKPVPVIGYYSNISKPKYAKLVSNYAKPSSGTWSLKAGVENNRYTGYWDVTDVPVTKNITFNEFDKVNVGIWKASGVLTTSYSSETTVGTSEYETTNYTSITYGNGTSNGILCYLTNGGENMETAQLR
ncbi:MAG: hypothetical protein MJ182_09185, partial [Treponema sp.]|nr:hypothetical protein [Treponema sp.]